MGYIVNGIKKNVTEVHFLCPHIKTKKYLKTNLKNIKVVFVDIRCELLNFIKKKYRNSILVSPDRGFEYYVRDLANLENSDYIVLSKKRVSPNEVRIGSDKITKNKIIRYKKCNFVILDDIVSTGNTLIEAKKYLLSLGIKKVVFMTIHNTYYSKRKSRLNIFTTNSIDGHDYKINITDKFFHYN